MEREVAAGRVRQLASKGESLIVDPNVPCRRYYRSGLEMVRMANVYLDEGNLENAYALFIKFMTLFIEKIAEHPDYKTVPQDLKTVNRQKLKEVMPLAEKLKAQLLDKYAAEERRNRQEEAAKKAEERPPDPPQQQQQPSAPPHEEASWNAPSALPDVLYPDDFATEPNRGTLSRYDPSAPPIQRQSKPKTSDSHNDSLLSGGSSLRTVIVPNVLMDRFLMLSASNTKANVETCGILTGKLERNRLIVTHMIVPKQSGTSDSCATKNEEEIFYYQDQKNLITIGWIHTHPTQTAFLSSVDLHTQCSYQLMMPEAIAIVCAPKYNETGYFSLTPHYGMSFISNCRQTGFHPHPNDPPLFKEVSHIKLDDSALLEVIDLRR